MIRTLGGFFAETGAIAGTFKKATGKRILLQYGLADSGKPVDPVSEINRFHRHQDPHLRGDLDHRLILQNTLPRVSKSGTFIPMWILIFAPSRDSRSMMHSGTGTAAVGLSSINDGTGP